MFVVMAFVNPLPGKEDGMVKQNALLPQCSTDPVRIGEDLRLEGTGREDACRRVYVDGRGRVQESDGEYTGTRSNYAPR